MKFDRSKVVDGLCDNLEQWIGWEGYCADSIVDLKNTVENEQKLTKIVKVENKAFWTAYYWWNLFYPINPQGGKMKLWEKMLEEERERFDYMRKKIDEDEKRAIDAIQHFVETGLCREMNCIRCPFRIECNACNIKNGKVLGSEYLKKRLTSEVEE